MYKFVVLATIAASASAGVQIAPAGLGYAGLGYAGVGYNGLALNGLGYAGLGYAQAPVIAAQAPIVAPVQKAYALPAPRTIPGPTLRSEVVEPVEQWGYDVAY